MPNLIKFDFFASDVAASMQCNDLHALADAAARLERLPCLAPPDLHTEREKRKMATRMRQFEEMQRKQKRQEDKTAAAARVRTRTGAPLVGKLLWKEFNDQRGMCQLYQGQVMSVEWATKDCAYDFGAQGTATVKYSVLYEDGDSEDMTYADVLKYSIE